MRSHRANLLANQLQSILGADRVGVRDHADGVQVTIRGRDRKDSQNLRLLAMELLKAEYQLREMDPPPSKVSDPEARFLVL